MPVPLSDLDELTALIDLRLPKGSSAESYERVMQFIDHGKVIRPGFPDVPYDDGGMWALATDRSLRRYLHGFLFFQDWPNSAQKDSAGRIARTAYEVSQKWQRLFAAGDSTDKMAFHDETTAQRLSNHLAMLPSFTQHLSPSEVEKLHSFLDSTAMLLADDEFHAAGNNHGMFQDLALLSYSIKATWRSDIDRDKYFELAERRLMSYFLSSFTSDGVHKENAPTYHLMICNQVRRHRDLLRVCRHPDAKVLDVLLAKAALYATHAVQPNGQFPQISDTQQLDLAAGARGTFADSEYAYAATAGKSGSQPTSRTLVLPDSGYAIYRSAWGDPNSTYVFFNAAYNADYHKHSDDLSLLIRHRGLDLLAESGPFGYNYSDPLTKYAFSQYAHNNVVVDGRSTPRTDDKAKTVTMDASDVRPDGFRVTGSTGRLAGADHSRTVEIEETSGETKIDVFDVVTADAPHTYEMFWNIGNDVVPVVHGQGFELFRQEEKVMDLFFQADVPTQVSLHRGETSPRHLGWRFPKFGAATPGNVVRISFEGQATSMNTRIRFHDFSYKDRSLVDPQTGWKRSSTPVGLNYLQVPATTNAGKQFLVVCFSAIGLIGDFTYNYKTTIDDIDVAALYILDDFGDQGAYYLQDHGSKAIFDAVQQLIDQKLKEAELGPEQLITVGSSKGGTAALIHGLAAGAGNIFAGAPQTRIGTFVSMPHPNVLRYMTGGDDDAAVASLDRVLYDLAEDCAVGSRIRVLVGDKDHHYKGHVLPFARHLRNLGHVVQVDALPGLPHSEIGRTYRLQLQDYLDRLVNGQSVALAPEPNSGKPARGKKARLRALAGRIRRRQFPSPKRPRL